MDFPFSYFLPGTSIILLSSTLPGRVLQPLSLYSRPFNSWPVFLSFSALIGGLSLSLSLSLSLFLLQPLLSPSSTRLLVYSLFHLYISLSSFRFLSFLSFISFSPTPRLLAGKFHLCIQPGHIPDTKTKTKKRNQKKNRKRNHLLCPS